MELSLLLLALAMESDHRNRKVANSVSPSQLHNEAVYFLREAVFAAITADLHDTEVLY